jgi:hypothetical protein
MKMDVGLSVEGEHLSRMEEVGRVAEEIGFSGLWTSETTHDSFLPLVVAAARTQRIQLGNAVAFLMSAFGRRQGRTSRVDGFIYTSRIVTAAGLSITRVIEGC